MNTDIEELVQYFANTWKLVDRLDQDAIRGTHNSKNIPTLSFLALQGRTASWLVSQAYQPPAKPLATFNIITTISIRNGSTFTAQYAF